MEEYLAHWGIKGQRWGFRRFQNEDGTLTPAGKQRYRSGGEIPRHAPSEARKAAIAEEAARKFEERRKQVLRTGNATEVLKYKNFSTKAELNEAYERIKTERNLKDLSDKERTRGKAIVDRVLDFADTWRARGEKASNVWNFVAKVHNSFSDEEDAWQQIGQPSVREAWEKKKKEKAEALEKRVKEKLIADYVREYGDYNQVTSNLDKMTLKEAKRAMERFTPKDKAEYSKRQRLINEYLLKYGSSKKVEANLPNFSTEQLEELLRVNKEKKKKEDE